MERLVDAGALGGFAAVVPDDLSLIGHSAVCQRPAGETARQWIRYVVIAVIALFLVWWMLRVYVL
jgi:hypothetical protein